MENLKFKNNEIPIEEVTALYFDKDVIKESGISLRRLDWKGQRNYFTIDANNQLDKIYTSVTTFTKSVLPTSPYLLDWMKNKSKEEQEFILKSSSTFGTLMDILFNKLLIDGKLEDISTQVYSFTMKEGLYSVNQSQWTDQLKKDCLAFAQFVKDYEVRPILVSCPLASDFLEIAGTLDLLCEMNHKIPTKTDLKNKDFELKRIKAIIDYKAKIGDMSEKHSRDSFYDGECLQLQIYKMLANEFLHSENIHIDSLYNFSPKNWRTEPDYNLKCWNDSKVYSQMEKKFTGLFSNWQIDNENSERFFTLVENNLSLENFESEFRRVDLKEFINQGLAEKVNEPEGVEL